MKNNNQIILALSILLGLIIGSFTLGNSIKRFKKEDRYISVKGFSEQEVKSDLVIWSIKVKITTDDLKEGNSSIESSKNKVMQFLIKNGISENEITLTDLTVHDRDAVEYTQKREGSRYIIEETIEVRSKNVDLVQKVSRMSYELLNAGVALSTKSDWTGGGLKFLFTKLNEIKPTMLIEATKNAKNAAIQFAKESDVSLGLLRKASQGSFSIEDRDSFNGAQSDNPGYYGSGTLDLYKKVRVVINCEYSIE